MDERTGWLPLIQLEKDKLIKKPKLTHKWWKDYQIHLDYRDSVLWYFVNELTGLSLTNARRGMKSKCNCLFLPVCVSGNFAMMKKLKQFLKASLKNERTRKERSLSVFLLDKSYRANMIWTADGKSGKMVTPLHIIFGKHGHLSEHGCNILFNMFPYVSNVCYSGLTRLCKLYLLRGRKDYERILNVIKI